MSKIYIRLYNYLSSAPNMFLEKDIVLPTYKISMIGDKKLLEQMYAAYVWYK